MKKREIEKKPSYLHFSSCIVEMTHPILYLPSFQSFVELSINKTTNVGMQIKINESN